MRVLLFFFLYLFPLLVFSQRPPYTLDNYHEGTYELVGYFADEYTPETPGYLWKVHLRDTLIIEVERTIKRYRSYNMSVYEPKRQYPFGVLRKQKIKERMNHVIGPYGDATVPWMRRKNYKPFNLADERAWFLLTQCALPVPAKQLEKGTRWTRKQFRQIIRNEYRQELELEYSFWCLGEEEVLGYNCHKVQLMTSTGSLLEGHEFSQKGIIYYEIGSGKIIRLDLQGSWQLNDSPIVLRGGDPTFNPGFFSYTQAFRLTYQLKKKRKGELIRQSLKELEATENQRAELISEYDWVVPPIYHKLQPFKNGRAFAAQLNGVYYLLGEDGEKRNDDHYELVKDAYYNGYAIAFDDGHWFILNPSGEQAGEPFENGSVQFNRAGQLIARRKGQWEVWDTTGAVLATPQADEVNLSPYGYTVKLSDKMGAYNHAGKLVVPAVYERAWSLRQAYNGHVFFAGRRNDSLHIFDDDGQRLLAAAGKGSGGVVYPYFGVRNDYPITHTRLYHLERGKWIGVADAYAVFNRTDEYYYGLDTLSEQKFLIRLQSGDTLVRAAIIKEHSPSTEEEESPLLFYVSDGKNGQSDRHGSLINEYGDTLYENVSATFQHFGDYIKRFKERGFYLFTLEGEQITFEPYTVIRKLNRHQFWVSNLRGRSGVFDCRTRLMRELPYNWEYERLLSPPGQAVQQIVITKDGKQGLVNADFELLFPPVADKIEAYTKQGLLVKFGGKQGIIKRF